MIDPEGTHVQLLALEHVGSIDNFVLVDAQVLTYEMYPHICNISCYTVAINFHIITIFHVVNLL